MVVADNAGKTRSGRNEAGSSREEGKRSTAHNTTHRTQHSTQRSSQIGKPLSVCLFPSPSSSFPPFFLYAHTHTPTTYACMHTYTTYVYGPLLPPYPLFSFSFSFLLLLTSCHLISRHDDRIPPHSLSFVFQHMASPDACCRSFLAGQPLLSAITIAMDSDDSDGNDDNDKH
ncbi:hypothetical protein B0J11DRAFT_537928 [Dendryphion nanum]|uniref:Uncharacterized protein n=1 Tax=Dendryphion nanum TaxID=256645 RepID=A0A9P9DAR9_9PLEO|nr:hypothetical protein B0J11DRAFT_537928 [Dendryphion nanum]